ncbi:hypothetical protein FACS1894142_6050 [Spirochaetia bacterium]|nr:hypothetical protein FACS1894142_6050 [Spirochaetia bacterium]
MKIFDDILNKKSVFHILFVIFLLVLTSCEKNNKLSEINNNENIIEEEIIENNDSKNDLGEEFAPIIIKPQTPGLTYDDIEPQTPPAFKEYGNDMVYKYEGTGSMKFGEYFKLSDNRIDDFER